MPSAKSLMLASVPPAFAAAASTMVGSFVGSEAGRTGCVRRSPHGVNHPHPYQVAPLVREIARVGFGRAVPSRPATS